VKTQGIRRRADGGTGGDHVVDQHELPRHQGTGGKRRCRAGVIATGPSPAVRRRRQHVAQRHIEVTGKTHRQFACRIDAVGQLSGPGPGHRHDRESGDPGTNHLDHQIGVVREPSILEDMDQLACRTGMLESGYEADATVENPLRRRPQAGTTAGAEVTGTERVAGLAKHNLEATGTE